MFRHAHAQPSAFGTALLNPKNRLLGHQALDPHEDQGFKLLAPGPTAAIEDGPGLNDQKSASLRAQH